MKGKTIAVDFDGVIHAYSKGWHDGTIYDKPIPGSLEALSALKERGYCIVIFTARKDTNEVYIWLWTQYSDKYGKSFTPFFSVTNRKPLAIAYIDDRAVHFTNWQEVLSLF